jgi:prolyl-tRNA synthetase
MSNLFGATRRNAPARTEAEGDQLLVRAGFVRQVGQGMVAYLPLGARALRKIESVLREELDAAGGQEISMRVVPPKSARDVVAELCTSEVSSYRHLPRLVYHLSTTADAYSLDADEGGLELRYRAQYAAYVNVFNRLALPVIAAGADPGKVGARKVGGELAHGFVYPTPVGEDTLVLCDRCGYAANRQIASVRKPEPDGADPLPISKVATPGTTTIADLASFLDLPPSRTAKALFMAVEREQGDGTVAVEPIVAIVRGDMEGSETKLANAVGGGDLRPMTEEEITKIGAVAGYGSPIGVNGATVVVDELVAASTNLVAGANDAGWHYLNTNYGRDYPADVVADITAARDGDACAVCGSPVRTTRGVEVGSIVKLGTRFSSAVGASYLDAEGRQRPVVMGSYGIGVARALACVAEEHRDERGLRLPITVAPYQVHLCRLGGADAEEVRGVANNLYDELRRRGVEVLYDDRGERAGVQFADADLIGSPVRLTVGGKALAQGCVEVKRRDADTVELVALDEAVEQTLGRLRALYAEIQARVVPVDLA